MWALWTGNVILNLMEKTLSMSKLWRKGKKLRKEMIHFQAWNWCYIQI